MFTHIRAATAADWAAIGEAGRDRHRREFYWCLRLLAASRWVVDGFPVSQLDHGLQLATRLERAGASAELVVAGLVHDVAKPLSVIHHDIIIAEMMREYVSDNVYMVLRHHGEFLSDITHNRTDARDRYRPEPWYWRAMMFAELDAASFDPDYPSLPLAHFLPRLRALYRLGHFGSAGGSPGRGEIVP